jgi:ribosomal protein S18 acetylase RimI-like enzyme
MIPTDHLTLPDPPSIPGLRFRPPAGVSDADDLLAVRLACADRDQVDPLSSAESLPTRQGLAEWLAAVAPGRAIVAEIEGRAVGYNRLNEWTEADGTHVWLSVGWVLPEWRGRGLGTALLHWSEGRTRELAGRMREKGEGENAAYRWEYAGNASQTEPEATALLLDNGYGVGYTVLEMGLDWAVFAAAHNPVAALPEGLTLRAGNPDDAARIAASVAESYRNEYEGGRFGEVFDAAAFAAELRGSEHDPALWRVAYAGDEVVGQVIPLFERDRAEIYEVSVRPAWRRGGVGRTLLTAALLGLREREIAVVRLNTVAEFQTRAVDLYRSLGFSVLKEFPRYRKAG